MVYSLYGVKQKKTLINQHPLPACWKITRDHRARLVSSNRERFAYYQQLFSYFLTVFFFFPIPYIYKRGEFYDASLGFG